MNEQTSGEKCSEEVLTVDAEKQNKKKPKKNVKIIIVAIAAIAVIAIAGTIALFATHILCFHSWSPSTCTQPETCSVCQRVQGEVLGHDWQEATCTSPSTCLNCGEVKGKEKGHDIRTWEIGFEATCAQVGERHGTCELCGLTVSEELAKLSHSIGEWKIVAEPIINPDGTVTPGRRSLLCTTCESELDYEETTVELTLEQTNALRKARSCVTKHGLGYSYSGVIDELVEDGYTWENAEFAANHCGADWNQQAAKYAKFAMESSSHSRKGLIEALEYRGFTIEQINYALESVGY